MIELDDRSFCVALVADELLNDNAAGFDVLGVLDSSGWGVIALPPAWYGPALAAPLLEQVAEHVQEFHRHRYAIVQIGERDGLAQALEAAGMPQPDRIEAHSADQLARALGERVRSVAADDAAWHQRRH